MNTSLDAGNGSNGCPSSLPYAVRGSLAVQPPVPTVRCARNA
jgi:hypothetical protein